MLSVSEGPLLIAFATVVRVGSFSAAAKQLKLSKSVLSDRVQKLEALCGTRLLERTTRRMRLTDAGQEVLAAATRIEDALGQLASSLDARRVEPSGVLRVSTTVDLGALLVGPAVARFVAQHPKVRVEIVSSDAPLDMLAERIDVAVRLGSPKASSFVVRKLAVFCEPIVAAPDLADTLGRVSRPRHVAAAPWVRHSLVAGRSLRFCGPGSAREEISPRIVAEANSGATLLSLLLSGVGVGVLPEHALREHLQSGRLVRLCPGWIWRKVALYALMPSGSSGSLAVKAFVATLRAQAQHDALRWSSTTTD